MLLAKSVRTKKNKYNNQRLWDPGTTLYMEFKAVFKCPLTESKVSYALLKLIF